MAADLASLTVSIDGSSAIQSANQIMSALTNMGNAGDTAGQKISKMSQPMKQATADANAVKGGMDTMGKSMETASGHSAKLGQQMMYAERSVHDLLSTFGMGGGPANIVGRFFRGIEDGVIALQKGGVAMAAFMVTMGAFSVAMAGIAAVAGLFKAAIDQVGAAMKIAGEEEKLGIAIKDVVGNAKAASAELEQLKDFATSSLGAVFKFDDLVEGTRRLQLYTGEAKVTEEQLKMLASAAELNHQSFQHVAEQYGKAVEAIQTGNPVRTQLLAQMVAEGLITQQTQAKVETLAKAHADWKTVLAALNQGLQQSDETANELSNSYENLSARLGRVFEMDVAAPIGRAFTDALKEPMARISEMLTSHKKEIQDFADGLEYALMYAIVYVEQNGILGALKDGWDKLLDYFKTTIVPGFQEAFQGWWKNEWDQFAADMKRAYDNIKQRIIDLAQGPQPGSVPAGGYVSQQDAVTQANARLQGLINAGLGQGDKEFDQAVQDLKAAEAALSHDMNDAGSKIQNATNDFRQSIPSFANVGTVFGANAAIAFLNSPGMQQFLQFSVATAGTGAGGTAPFAGASRGMSEWKPGDRVFRDVMEGKFGAMGVGDIALSADKMIELFGSIEAAGNKYVDILDKEGNVILAHQRVRDISYRTTGEPNVNTYEVWGRDWDAWGRVVRSTTGTGVPYRPGQVPQEDPIAAEARRRMEQSRLDQQKDTASKIGPTTPFEKPAKASKDEADALRAIKDQTDQLTNSYKLYGKEVERVNREQQSGAIGVQQATEEKLALAKREQTTLEQGIALLEKQEAATKAAYPKADLTSYDEKIKTLKEDLADILQTEKDLGGTDPWTAFREGVQKAVDTVGTMQQQLTQIGQTTTEEFASGFASMFTSITDGSKTAKQAILDFAKSFLDAVEQMILKMIVMDAIGKVLGMFGGTGGTGAAAAGQAALSSAANLAHGQMGGLVYGPSGVDRVPSLLTAGEYVINKSAVDRLGVGYLAALNHFASGGFVGAGTSPMNTPPSMNSGHGSGSSPVSVTTNVTVGGPGGPPGKGGATPSKEDLTQFQTVLTSHIKQVISTEKRPGGLLNRNSY